MDDFYLINNFIINLEGAIRNITIQNTDRERIKLIYYNSNKGQINEYFIVPPKYLDINLDIYTDNKIIEIDLNEYFERRTNTNYYISFNNIFSEFVKIKLNNKDIESINTFEKLNPDENILKFILEKYPENEHYIIEYQISIEETYSTICEINLNIINNCYESCSICSLNGSYSSNENHNCIKCRNNYYPFGENGTNCYIKEDVENYYPNWYFNEIKNFFEECYKNCKECTGPSEYDCLKCKNENLYLYNGTCLDNCPIRTLNSKNIYEINMCEQCYENCETCEDKGTPNEMHCTSSLRNTIKFRGECFKIYDESSKAFYHPQCPDIITSCNEYLNNYIKENENECISEIEKGYFVSNSATGLLSKCHELCETCSKNYTENNENCDTCIKGFVQEGKCVNNCSDGYYLDNNKCIKCYENCLSCEQKEEKDSEGKIIKMKCIQCKNNMIKVEENCFPIIEYSNTKITFNISDIETNNI